MDYKLEEAGRYRANPEASEYNTASIVDEENPGTPANDSLVIDTSGFSGGEVVSGINYTGRSEAAEDIHFTKQQRPDAQETPYSVTIPALTAGYDPAELRAAIRRAVGRRESESIVKVSYDNSGDELTITHTGSGTLNKLIVDGAPVGSNTRSAITATPQVQAKTKAKTKAKGQGKAKASTK